MATVIKIFSFVYPTRLMWAVWSSNTDIESSQINQYNGIAIFGILISNQPSIVLVLIYKCTTITK